MILFGKKPEEQKQNIIALCKSKEYYQICDLLFQEHWKNQDKTKKVFYIQFIHETHVFYEAGDVELRLYYIEPSGKRRLVYKNSNGLQKHRNFIRLYCMLRLFPEFEKYIKTLDITGKNIQSYSGGLDSIESDSDKKLNFNT